MPTDRRQFIKTVGGIGAVAVGGAGATHYASQPTRASVRGDIQASQSTLRGHSDNGNVEDVRIWTVGRLSWSLDYKPINVKVAIEIDQPRAGGRETIAEQTFTDVPETKETDSPWEYPQVTASVIENSTWTADHFSSDDGTKVTEFDAVVRAGPNSDEGPVPSTNVKQSFKVEVNNAIEQEVNATPDWGGNVTMEG